MRIGRESGEKIHGARNMDSGNGLSDTAVGKLDHSDVFGHCICIRYTNEEGKTGYFEVGRAIFLLFTVDFFTDERIYRTERLREKSEKKDSFLSKFLKRKFKNGSISMFLR